MRHGKVNSSILQGDNVRLQFFNCLITSACGSIDRALIATAENPLGTFIP
jgi:hypothetical protein